MAKLTPQEYADKWARNTTQAVPDYKAGVSKVTVSPGQSAADNVDAYVAAMQESIANGTWKTAMQSVSLQDWKDAATNVGAARIAAGVNAAKDGQVAMAQKLFAAIAQAQQSISNMPRATFEDRMARMTAFITAMHNTPIK